MLTASNTSKNSKNHKRRYYLPSHCLNVNVLLSNITFYDLCCWDHIRAIIRVPTLTLTLTLALTSPFCYLSLCKRRLKDAFSPLKDVLLPSFLVKMMFFCHFVVQMTPSCYDFLYRCSTDDLKVVFLLSKNVLLSSFTVQKTFFCHFAV